VSRPQPQPVPAADLRPTVAVCKKKEAVRLRPIRGGVGAVERPQRLHAVRDIDQLPIGADLEDETVGPSLCIKGQGRGTNACTQCNDERERAVSRP